MKKTYFKAIFALLALLIIYPLSRADYHYASHSGSNTYPYTSWETATDSIKYAIAAADPGDTVYIGPGTFYEKVNMTGADSSLALIGMGMDSTHWWFNDPADFTLNCSDNTYIQGIHFFDTEGPPVSTYFNNAVSIDHCHFTLGGITIFGGCWVSVENCVFDTVDFAIGTWTTNYSYIVRNNIVNLARDVGFFLETADTAIVENNIVFMATSEAILIRQDTDSSLVRNNLIYNPTHAFRYSECYDCRNVINNTFDNIKDPFYNAAYAIIVTYYGPQNIRNNSFSRIQDAVILVADGNPRQRVEYCNLWDVDSLAVANRHAYPIHLDTLGITWNDPMYSNPDSGDFQLQAFSPLIDAGDPSIFDIDGTRSDVGVFGGPYGSSYPYIDLPPRTPDSLSFSFEPDTIFLSWRQNFEADFYTYGIYRDTLEGFAPSAFNLIVETNVSSYIDADVSQAHDYFYRIAAEDNQGNVSEYSIELAVLLTGIEGNGGAETPSFTAIESNYPNPFNSHTTIVYKVANLGPIPALINIDIYDILGRHIRTLLNDKKEIGIHRVIWDGLDDGGHEVNSGIYFLRISQWGIAVGKNPRKVVLAR